MCLPVGATDSEYATTAEAEVAIIADKEKRAGTDSETTETTETTEEEEQEDDGSFDWFWEHKIEEEDGFDRDVRSALKRVGRYNSEALWDVLRGENGEDFGLALVGLQDDSEPEQLKDLIEALMPFVYDDYDETYPELQKHLNDVIEERDAHWEEIGRKNAEITSLKEEIAAKDREIAELKAEAPANFRRFLSGHATMLVKFHRVVRHDRMLFHACVRQDSSSEI